MNPTATQTQPELVTLSVNGQEMQFPKGKNLLAALLESDIQIPHYCWHPSLSIAGNCRLCLVEIEGQPRPNISCNMTCTDGLKIRTEGELVEDCRKGMMEFLLVNHPLDCPICDRGGECMLQRYSSEYGTGTARTVDERRRFEKPQFDPLIDIERNRCIMCTRCVRFMDEIGDQHLLGVFGRGNRNHIGTFGDGPVANIFSGNIIDVCPVGCLTSKPFRFKARAWELQQVASTCTQCSAGCPTTAWVRNGDLLRMTPPVRRYQGEYTLDEDTTQFICNEGRFGTQYANSPERLTTPLMRGATGLESCSWDEALDAAAEALRSAREAGAEKVAILAGSRATNEEYYLLSRLARSVLGTNQIDWRLNFMSPEAADWAAHALGASDGDLDVLQRAGYDATLVIHCDPWETVPVVGLKIKEAARNRLTRLAMIGARLDPFLGVHAEATEVATPDALAPSIARLTQALAGGSEASPESKALFDLVSEAQTGLLVVGVDTAGGALNSELMPEVFNLLSQLGEGWSFLPVAQGRNVKGAYAAGAESDRAPGGALDSSAARNRMAELWGRVAADETSGPSAPETVRRAARGEIQTLLLHRPDDWVYHPQRALIEQAIEKTPCVIVIDVFPSWITDGADVVLPGALFYETTGSYVSIDGTLQTATRANEPRGDSQEDWRILESLAARLGSPFGYESAQQIFQELLGTWTPPSRFRFEDLQLEGPGPESPQRAKSGIRRKTRPDFKVRHRDRPDLAAGPPQRAEFAPGRLHLLWQNGIQGADHLGSRSSEFADLRPEATIEMTPRDAKDQGLEPGRLVRITGCRNSARVKLNARLARGVVFGAANSLGLELEATAAGLPEVTLDAEGESA